MCFFVTLLIWLFGVAPFFRVGSELHFFISLFVTLGGQPALNRYVVKLAHNVKIMILNDKNVFYSSQFNVITSTLMAK
jgi:hypothetical protein